MNGVLNSTKYFDDIINKWTLSTSMIDKRLGHSVVAFREKIYILKGHSLEVGDLLDTKTMQLTVMKPMQIPRLIFATATSGTTYTASVVLVLIQRIRMIFILGNEKLRKYGLFCRCNYSDSS